MSKHEWESVCSAGYGAFDQCIHCGVLKSRSQMNKPCRSAGKDQALTLSDLLANYGRTQTELAELIGSRSHASEFLSGRRPLPLSVRKALHDQWGIGAGSLLRLPAGGQANG